MRFPIGLVSNHAAAALRRAGLSAEHATAVAEVLVDAEVRGHSSHGLALLSLYIQRIELGGIRRSAQPRWIDGDAAVAILDAQGVAGQVSARMGAERCALLAAQRGVAAVAVRNS